MKWLLKFSCIFPAPGMNYCKAVDDTKELTDGKIYLEEMVEM